MTQSEFEQALLERLDSLVAETVRVSEALAISDEERHAAEAERRKDALRFKIGIIVVVALCIINGVGIYNSVQVLNTVNSCVDANGDCAKENKKSAAGAVTIIDINNQKRLDRAVQKFGQITICAHNSSNTDAEARSCVLGVISSP